MRVDSWDDVDLSEATSARAWRGSQAPSRTLDTLLGITGLSSFRQTLSVAASVGSGNFTLSVPIVEYPGRNLPFKLTMYYNSRLWQRLPSNRMVFDIDHDWPAPGWTFGFPHIVRAAGHRSIFIEGDGTRRISNLAMQPTSSAGRLLVAQRTTDGSFITYSHEEDAQGNLIFGHAAYPDGSIVEFEAPMKDGDALMPTQIIDRNGNAIWLYYEKGTSRISYLEACGQVVTFHYDASKLLTALTGTGPQHNDVPLVRLHYVKTQLQANFTSPVELPGSVTLIDAIYFPGTRSGYNFQDHGAYENFSPYGMLRKIARYSNMEMSPSPLTVQGEVTKLGTLMYLREYDYPSNTAALVDTPNYRTLTETGGHDQASARTAFSIAQVPGGTRTEITAPDLHRTVVTSKSAANAEPPVTTEIATYAADNRLIQRCLFAWEPGDGGSVRIKSITVLDQRDRERLTTFSYGAAENLVTEATDHHFGGVVARRVRTDYLQSPAYAGRHLRNLPTRIEVIDQEGAVASCTEYEYDSFELSPAPKASNHSHRFNPGDSSFDPSTSARGNPTVIRKFARASKHESPVAESRRYDVCGNLRIIDTDLRRDEFVYSAQTRFMHPEKAFIGSPELASQQRMLLWAISYDSGFPVSVVDASGETIAFKYDVASMEVSTIRSASLGWSCAFSVGSPWAAKRTMYLTADPSSVASEDTWLYDGYGHVYRHARSTGSNLVLEDVVHDYQGRLIRFSRPRWVNLPARWGSLTYDALGRIDNIMTADGDSLSCHYDELGPAGVASDDPSMRVVDSMGHDRVLTFDSLGRLSGVWEPDPDSNGSVRDPHAAPIPTSYRYDGNNNVIEMRTGRRVPGPFPAREMSFRRFRYDSLGRLTAQCLPELGIGLDESGSTSGNPLVWSQVLTYDLRSNVTSRKDARGVVIRYDYGGDPLDRLQRISYDLSEFSDLANPVEPVPDVRYSYAVIGDLRRMMSQATEGVCTETFEYGHETGRLDSSTITMAAAENFPFRVYRAYDSIGRVIALTYPALYDDANTVLPMTTLAYDVGGFVSKIDNDTITQDASGTVAEITFVGTGATSPVIETTLYSADSTLPEGKRISRDGTVLQDLTYEFQAGSLDKGLLLGRRLVHIADNLSTGGSRSYTYDVLGRLTRVVGGPTPAPSWAQDYVYDLVGNRTETRASGDLTPGFAVPVDGSTPLSYDKANRITLPGFAYDAAGNMVAARIEGKDFQYRYDAAGRAVFACNVTDGQTRGYLYGACSRRRGILDLNVSSIPTGGLSEVWAHTDTISAASYAVWHGDSVIANFIDVGPDFGDSVVWKDMSIYLGQRLLSTRINVGGGDSRTQWNHTSLDRTRLVTRADGSYPHENLPYGGALVHNGDATYTFDSYVRDREIQIDYALNRVYAPSLTRFIQPDPLARAALLLTDPQGFNLYLYCGGDPVNRTDPTGLMDAITGCVYTEWGGQCTTYYEASPGGTQWERTDGPEAGPQGPRGAGGRFERDFAGFHAGPGHPNTPKAGDPNFFPEMESHVKRTVEHPGQVNENHWQRFTDAMNGARKQGPEYFERYIETIKPVFEKVLALGLEIGGRVQAGFFFVVVPPPKDPNEMI